MNEFAVGDRVLLDWGIAEIPGVIRSIHGKPVAGHPGMATVEVKVGKDWTTVTLRLDALRRP
jgi:hypothetical protein